MTYLDNSIKLNYEDVLIRPKRSTIQSREGVDLTRDFTFLYSNRTISGFPIIAANMDTIGTFEMAHALGKLGCFTALHKYYKEEHLVKFFAAEKFPSTFYSMGIKEHDLDTLMMVKKVKPVAFINIDVANGYSQSFLEFIEVVRGKTSHNFYSPIIMAGNVATPEMAEAVILAGADIVKVGIGPGTSCKTREVTGVGYPQLSAVLECQDAAHGLGGHVCADGGCTQVGDICKAFAAGADFVMLGYMLAAHDECGTNSFYGMASSVAHGKYGVTHKTPEGVSLEIEHRGSVDRTIEEIKGGVRSMMTYIGARRIKDVPRCTTFSRINYHYDANF